MPSEPSEPSEPPEPSEQSEPPEPGRQPRHGLVLGGGGVAGIAWEFGLLAGLADAGIDVTGADLLVGTSAGSVVAAVIGTGVGLERAFAAQLEPPEQSAELATTFDLDSLQAAAMSTMRESGGDPVRFRAAIGAVAMATETVSKATRREIIAARLPVHDWPDRDLRIVAVDATTGVEAVFTRDSGAGLVDVVGASCAVPGVWPPVTIGERRYIDGGLRSVTNADLAAGCDAVLVLSPMTMPPGGPFPSLDDERAALAPARVLVVTADEAYQAASGANPLDPSTREPCARAGRAQAAAVADAVRSLWSAPE